jgi:DNA-binding MarR family transcriptional regulator
VSTILLLLHPETSGMNTYLLGLQISETFKIIAKKLSVELPKVGQITLEQYVLLRILSKKKELIQQDLALLMNRDKSQVLRLLHALEEKNLLIRFIDKNDRRKKHLSITKKGANVLKLCLERETEIISELLGGIEEKKLKVFSEVLARIKNNSNLPVHEQIN